MYVIKNIFVFVYVICPRRYDLVSYQDSNISDVTTIYHIPTKKIATYLLIGWIIINNYSCANFPC